MSEETEDLRIDESYIKSIIQKIVNNKHTNPYKREVRVKAGGGFQIACPYCGDSEKNPRNYRGNLNKLLFYKCFNDGCERQTHFTQMCRDFNVDIDIDTKKQIYDYLDRYASTVEALQDELLENGLKYLIDLNELVDCINENKCDIDLSDFKPIEQNSRQFWYLVKNRGLDPKLFSNIYQANYHITGDWVEPVIVFMNKKKDKIIGMQVRNLKEGHKRLFHIYTFKDLYETVGTEEISDGQMVMYNKLSYYYGILNVDFNQPITIFEGYGDAILCPNSIGVVGVNTDLKFFEENNLNVRYFFDNDNAGHRKTEQKINSNFSSFLWNKFFEMIVDKKNSSDPYHLKHKISKVNDLTSLNKIIKGAYIKFEMSKYFSKDKYDLKYVPKVKFKKWIKD